MPIKVVYGDRYWIQLTAEKAKSSTERKIYGKLVEFLDNKVVEKVFDSPLELQKTLDEWPKFVKDSGVYLPFYYGTLSIQDFGMGGNKCEGIGWPDDGMPGLSIAVALIESL